MDSNKYNILFIEHGAKIIGGGHFSTLLLIKSLNRRLFNPVVVCSNENYFTDESRKLGAKVEIVKISKKITSIYRVRIKYNPLSLFNYVLHIVIAIIRIAHFIKKNNIHIVHPCDNLTRIIGGMAAKLTGRHAVCHVRDELVSNSFINRILKVFILLSMDKVIAVSDKIKKLLEGPGNISKKVVTIYNGVDLYLFNPDNVNGNSIREKLGVKEGMVLIAIIGALIPLKGHIILFRALKKLKDDGFINIACLVVGSGPEDGGLQNFIKENDLNENVFFVGFRKDIPCILSETDILVLPSFTEAFPRVVIEAMAMKVPVVATNVGGIPEAIENQKTGLLIPPGDTDALCSAIKLLVENPDMRIKMGTEGRERAEMLFANEKNIKKIEMLYFDVLENYSQKEELNL